MLGQTAAVLVAFPTFFTSQIATTSLAVALGQARALARATVPRLGVGLVLLQHGCECRSVGESLAFSRRRAITAGPKLRAIAGHTRRHCGVEGHVGAPELRCRLGRAAQAITTTSLERRP